MSNKSENFIIKFSTLKNLVLNPYMKTFVFKTNTVGNTAVTEIYILLHFISVLFYSTYYASSQNFGYQFSWLFDTF